MEGVKKLFFGGNWKAAVRPSQAAGFFAKFAAGLRGHVYDLEMAGARVVVAPPSACLSIARQALVNEGLEGVVGLAVQDPWIAEGAYTGATTFEMAQDPLVGAQYALIGHSETREPHRIYRSVAVLDETRLIEISGLTGKSPRPFRIATDAVVNRMTRKALEVGMTPIVCVGETLEEREAGKTRQIIEHQMSGALAGFTPEQVGKMVIAYEPVWAIGTGRTATPEQAQEVHEQIARILMEHSHTAENVVPVIYGGSMKPDNVAELVTQRDIHGGLIGGASLKPEVFLELILKGVRAFS